ncbi:hypothetical protein PE36_11072, partial [Moritella sp. PE36]
MVIMIKKITIGMLFVLIQFSVIAKSFYILGPGDKV